MDPASSRSAIERHATAAAALKENHTLAESRSNGNMPHDTGGKVLGRGSNALVDNPERLRVAPGTPGKVGWSNTKGGPARHIPLSYENPFGDSNSLQSSQPSCAVFSESSVLNTTIDTLNTRPEPSLTPGHFLPETPLGKGLVRPRSPLGRPGSPDRAGDDGDEDEGSLGGYGSHQTAQSQARAPGSEALRADSPHSGPVPAAADAPMPETAVTAAAEMQSTVEETQNKGRRIIKLQKLLLISGVICVNFMFIFASWWWRQYYYIYLPFVAFPLFLNCCMIASIACFKLRNTIRAEKVIEPDHPESLVLLLPCYNETLEECTRSLDSLVGQVGIDDSKKAILVVCDGRVRGPGMQKSTADYLMEDILVDQFERGKIRSAYRAWDGQRMNIEVSRGTYKGLPFYCVVKEQNMGKRDSLIVARSFLYKFNMRRTNPKTIFSAHFFHSMSNWLARDVAIDKVDHLIGMDADTVFDKNCIGHLLAESRYPNTVGVCGYVAVDFGRANWNLWSLYQNAEYTIAQGLRRLHQSIATHKVSCLPGCCQLLKICEFTCGDRVLLERFAYHPTPLDNIIKQILATASEDRNHVCLMLMTHPAAQTRQALRAKAFTDVPHSWAVFLSQRRRWTLGATSNDLMLLISKHCQWWERLVALSNVLVWSLNAFVIASIGCMVVAFATQPVWIIMVFVGFMLIPIVYYVGMVTWLPRTPRERVQYLLGLVTFVIGGPLMGICVMLFAMWNMDSFGWGKTRVVVSDDDEKSSTVSPAGQNASRDEEASVGMASEKQGEAPLDAARQA